MRKEILPDVAQVADSTPIKNNGIRPTCGYKQTKLIRHTHKTLVESAIICHHSAHWQQQLAAAPLRVGQCNLGVTAWQTSPPQPSNQDLALPDPFCLICPAPGMLSLLLLLGQTVVPQKSQATGWQAQHKSAVVSLYRDLAAALSGDPYRVKILLA